MESKRVEFAFFEPGNYVNPVQVVKIGLSPDNKIPLPAVKEVFKLDVLELFTRLPDGSVDKWVLTGDSSTGLSFLAVPDNVTEFEITGIRSGMVKSIQELSQRVHELEAIVLNTDEGPAAKRRK